VEETRNKPSSPAAGVAAYLGTLVILLFVAWTVMGTLPWQ
jgi:amino acid transporter